MLLELTAALNSVFLVVFAASHPTAYVSKNKPQWHNQFYKCEDIFTNLDILNQWHNLVQIVGWTQSNC